MSLGVVGEYHWLKAWLPYSIDAALVLVLCYLILLVLGEGDRRTLWTIRGFIILMLATAISKQLGLNLLNFLLEKLVLGAAVAMAVIFQSQFRRFLEQIGRGELREIFRSSGRAIPQTDSVIDEIVDAVKELSQNRTGALIVLETMGTLDERDFVSEGVAINGEISKELLQTIFQTSTLLHDGAVVIRGSRLVGASAILPLSERTTSRQLGTRHRAAMGMTEKVENCLCIVVSEETGSISLAERGVLNRPLTSSKLKELLQDRFSPAVERDVSRLSRTLGFEQVASLFKRLLRLPLSKSPEKK